MASSMREPFHSRRRLVGYTGRTSATARDRERMQELALTKPSSTVDDGQTHKEAELALQREFEERLAECGPLTYRVARAVLRNTADAEEVGQEALLRAYRRFRGLRDRNRFRAWLVRITFRLSLDRARSAERRQQRETLWSQPGPVLTTEELAAATEFQAHVDRELAELSPKLRLVLLLSAMQGHTLEEVADILALPLGTVKSRLFLARKRLAERLRCHVKNTERP